jgi:hypothetical protein
MNFRGIHSRFFLAAALLILPGCGGAGQIDAPEVAPVKGKVTKNGTPLANVSVLYEPLDVAEGQNASSSSAMTNENGEYELVFNRDLMGAMVGKHRVKLVKDEPVDEKGKPVPDAVVIPSQYNSATELEVTVPAEGLEGGDANFDIDF